MQSLISALEGSEWSAPRPGIIITIIIYLILKYFKLGTPHS
jgi:hypothetical protein